MTLPLKVSMAYLRTHVGNNWRGGGGAGIFKLRVLLRFTGLRQCILRIQFVGKLGTAQIDQNSVIVEQIENTFQR